MKYGVYVSSGEGLTNNLYCFNTADELLTKLLEEGTEGTGYVTIRVFELAKHPLLEPTEPEKIEA